MKRRELRVAFVGVTTPGYRSLALDYVESAVLADQRLGSVAVTRLDVDVSHDAWWTAYRILRLDPMPDVVAFPVYCWTARHVYEAIRVLKAAAPAISVVVGGPEVGPIAEDVIATREGVDAVVRGEGERAFPDLLHTYLRGGDAGAVPGVTALVRGSIVSGPVRDAIEDIDSIPSPFQGRMHATDGSAYLETYRGCPHACAYCYEGKGSTRIRSFSWERIAADIEAVTSVPGMTSFSFIDPVFNLTRERLGHLADLLEPAARSGISLHTIEVDIEQVDTEQAALLRRAGVASVETGPQTVGARALDVCARRFDPNRFAAGVEACRSVGIAVECDIIVGLPGDTADDVMRSVEFAISLDPHRVQMSTLHVLPGTALWNQAAELGLTFDAEPPHEIIATRDLDFTQLRRLESWGRAAATIHRARIQPSGRR